MHFYVEDMDLPSFRRPTKRLGDCETNPSNNQLKSHNLWITGDNQKRGDLENVSPATNMFFGYFLEGYCICDKFQG